MDSVSDASTREYLAIRYVLVGTFALYTYEYALTFGDEVSLIWRSRMSMVKTLFFVNRYIPYSFILISLYTYVLNPEEMRCKQLFSALAMLSATGVVAAEIVLALRVYIIWENSKKILYALTLLILTGVVGGYLGTTRYIKDASFSMINTFGKGCIVHALQTKAEAISYGLILCYEAFVLTLMLIKVYRHRTASSVLIRIAYIDTVLYCVAILLVTTSNVILLKLGSEVLCHLLLLPQAALHNLLCSRLLLRLRSANSSLSEEGFLTIHVSQHLDSSIPLSLLSRP